MGAEDSRIEDIFAAALQYQSAAERAAYLCEACGGDTEVRGRLESLLRAHDQAGQFLNSADTVTTTQECKEKPGALIGPYKLLEQIGEGGFGMVYMAEQEHPIRRKVALKIIKPGMDTRQVIARFEAERQALALMDHPNIAKVFDAGETESGRPYFVMELVKGMPITAYCDQGKLPLRERLELFTHVCQAVQHAHYKGIIHRDIKPSNVLVTLHDGVPVVKVIDFGIAKATGQELTDKTVFTGFAQVLGTPLYCSPEQVALGGLDIDSRTDVYSLGVLLYELLTGSTPFEKERLQKAAYDEMRRIIREEEPPRPSTRMTTVSPKSTVIAAQRASQPRRLAQVFRGELDWIVMKALEKDRSRRYETPMAFAGDIGRYLSDEAVEARPPTAGYKMSKFVKRHTWGTAMAAAVILLLGLSTTLIWNEKRQTDTALEMTKLALVEAKQQRDLAGQHEEEARRLAIRAEEAEMIAQVRLEEANAAAARAKEAERVAVEAAERERQARREGLASLTAGPINAIAVNPEDKSAWYNLGYAFARWGEFDRAAGAFDRSLGIGSADATPASGREPSAASAPAVTAGRGAATSTRPADLAAATAAARSNTITVDFQTLWLSAYAYLQEGQLTKYADRCNALIWRYGKTTNLQIRERIANICASGPSTIDPRLLETLLDFDCDAKQTAELAAWTHLARGMVHYRNGDWKKSTNELSKSLAYNAHTYQQAAAMFYLAMATENMGDHEQARTLFKKATDFANSEIAPEAGRIDLGINWPVWITEQHAQQAAQVLFGLKPATLTATQPATAPRP